MQTLFWLVMQSSATREKPLGKSAWLARFIKELPECSSLQDKVRKKEKKTVSSGSVERTHNITKLLRTQKIVYF